jgi:hypothetical protein
MKTVTYKLQSTFFLLGFLLLALCANKASAQANYNGGQAGGYASINVSFLSSVTIGDSLVARQFEASVYPNPIKKGQALKYRIRNVDFGSKVTVIVSDILGNRLLTQEIEVNIDDSELALPQEKMAKGIYLVTFQSSKSKITRRISYTD